MSHFFSFLKITGLFNQRKTLFEGDFRISIDVSININGEHFQNTLHHTVYPMVPYNLTINEV